ncbi:MAG: membrane dipeptidase, partial [Bacteroidota bacterium]
MFFDLHNHPSLKSFLTATRPGERDDCWTVYRNFLDFLVGNIIDSQASLGQLDRSRTRLTVVALYAIEAGLDEVGLIRNWLPIVSHLDRKMVRNLSPEQYWKRFLDQVAHLEESLDKGPAPAQNFVIASKATDVLPDRNTLVLSVEGAHVLQAGDPLQRLNELKHFRHKIFYLTVCHFVDNPFGTQAFAMKLVNVRKNPVFLPRGTGLTELGYRLLTRAYDDSNGRRILIDVKHFSISSRRDFYAWKRTQPAYANLPIIASHVGVTGHSWAYNTRSQYFRRGYPERIDSLGQYLVQYDKPPGLKLDKLRSEFNPVSINLYDEDIQEIIDSGGLIGLMLDQRLLGVGKNPEEYFATTDFDGLQTETINSTSGNEDQTIAQVRRRGRYDIVNFVSPATNTSWQSLHEMITGKTPPVTDQRPRRLNRRRKT